MAYKKPIIVAKSAPRQPFVDIALNSTTCAAWER